MNRDDIIRMAREWLPKAYRDGDKGDEPKFTKYNMEVAFAAGAAAEREACAKVLDDMADDMAREMEPSTAVAWIRSKAAIIRARGQA